MKLCNKAALTFAVVFLLTFSYFLVAFAATPEDKTLTLKLASGVDDGNAYSISPWYSKSENSLWVGNWKGASENIWFRYSNVSIPRGATIKSAKLNIVANGKYPNANVRVYANLTGNAAAPNNKDDYFSKALSGNYVDWTIPAHQGDTQFTSPDLAKVIQEIVNQQAWSPGNALMLLVYNNSKTTGAETGLYAYEQGLSHAPQLIIEYAPTPTIPADWINVIKYGAVPNDQGDDTAAIQKAVDAAKTNGGTVYLPEGVFLTSGRINLNGYSNIKVNGIAKDKTTIRLKNGVGSPVFNIENSKNISFASLTVQGNRDSGGTGPGFRVKQSQDINYKNVRITGAGDNGMLFSQVTNAIVEGCTIDNIGGAGINATYQGMGIYCGDGGNITIKDSEISRTKGQGSIFAAGNVQSIVISNNYIHDTTYRAVETFGDNVHNVKIVNNKIRNTGSIITGSSAVGCNGIMIVGNHSTEDVQITGNNLYNLGENGIEIAGGGYVAFNTIENTGYRTDLNSPSLEGIYCGSNTVCKGNTIKNAGEEGIFVYADAGEVQSNITLAENTIVNPSCRVAGRAGIKVLAIGQGAIIDGISITGNTIITTGAKIEVGGASGGVVKNYVNVDNK